MRDKQRPNSEDRATQPMEAGGWVSQYIKQAFWLQYISLSLIYFILKIKICIAVCITMSIPTPILVLYVDNINGIPILVLDVDSYINGISQLLLLLVLPTAENSPNEVRARERESANSGDRKPLGADVDTVLIATPLSVHRFVLVRGELFIFKLLLLRKVCSAADTPFVVCEGHCRHPFGFCCC